MSVFSLAAHLGSPCAVDAAPLINKATAEKVYDLLLALADCIDPRCMEMDPIAVFEAMAQPESKHRLRTADLRLCELCP